MSSVIIDRNRCEGKADCLACPEDVLELREADFAELSWVARLKVRVHGGKQAVVVAPEKCTGCGLCVQVCPENAITVNP